MPTVAEQLRRAREEQQLDVYQVAELTKIKTDHIRSLEAGDYDAFSAPVYIRGFVRTYARALRLDEAQMMDALDAELAQTKRFREPPSLTGSHQGVLDFLMLQLSRLNWRIAAVAVALALVLILGVSWLRQRGTAPADPLRHLGPGLYHPAPQPGGEMLPLPTNPPAQSR